MLSRLNIHCRNSSFGCTEILSYDNLEHHENVQCKYLTQKCCKCKQLVLVSKLNEHREVPGLCLPHPIKCTICQNHIEKTIFREHFHECCQKRINESLERAFPQQTLGETVTPDNGMAFVQSIMNTVQLFEQQKQFSRLPTNLKGVDEIRRAREQNCGHIYHILLMLKFILLNWRKAPFFIFSLSTGGFIAIWIAILGGYIMFNHWAYKYKLVGPFLIILSTFVLSYGITMFFQVISDKIMILTFGILIFLCGCISRTSLELFEMNSLFNKPILSIIFCFIGILIMKIILLIIRFYYCSLPIYISAGLLSFINLYLGLKSHHIYTNRIARTTNQPLMPV